MVITFLLFYTATLCSLGNGNTISTLCSVGNGNNSATVCSVGNSNNICLIFVPATRFVLIWVSFQIVSLHFMAALEIQGGHWNQRQPLESKVLQDQCSRWISKATDGIQGSWRESKAADGIQGSWGNPRQPMESKAADGIQGWPKLNKNLVGGTKRKQNG